MRTAPSVFTAAITALAVSVSGCADATNPVTAPGAAIDAPAASVSPAPVVAVAVASRIAPGQCLTVGTTAPTAGTRATLAPCGAPATQRSFQTPNGALQFGAGLCLQANTSAQAGDSVVVQPCTGANTQRWILDAAPQLRSAASGLCLDVTTAGVVLNTCRNTMSQAWARIILVLAPASVKVTPGAVTLNPGATAQLSAELRDAAGNILTGRSVGWVSADTSVATVSSTGTVKAGRAGQVTITATSAGVPATAVVTVTNPPAPNIPVYPGQNIQAVVNANPGGSTIVFKAGTYKGQSIVPKSGMTFIGEAGAIMDGGNTVQYAFWPGYATPYPSGVHIQNLVIQNYAPPVQMGAVRAGGNSAAEGTRAWVVQDCEIRYNAAAGIRIGTAMQVLHNNVHHNGQIGIVGIGDSVLVENNEIAYNNYQSANDPGFEAGGTKFVLTHALVVRGNFVHHNTGPGLWTDVDNINTLVENNRVEDNAREGIVHEISNAAVIRNNTVARNGFGNVGWLFGAGIMISSSRDVEVYGNTVVNNFNGITAVQQNRGSGPYGARTTQNVNVHDNQVTMTVGRTGAGQDIGDSTVFTGSNNRFQGNKYVLGTAARYFEWANGQRTEIEWRGFGQDVSAAAAFTR